MATYEELIAAAKKQDAAGNAADAKRLAAMALKMRETPATDPGQTWGEWAYGNVIGNPDDGITNAGEYLGTFLNRAGESMTGGLVGDEASAAVTGMLPGRTYEDELDRYRANEEDLGLAGQVGADVLGGVVGALAGGGALKGAGIALPKAGSLLGRTGYGAAAGAGLGAVHGFMEGEGGFGNRVENAVTGGALGGVLGGATPALVAGGRALAGSARDMLSGGVDTVLGRASRGRANRAMARTMERAGMDQSAVARALAGAVEDGQDAFRVMDALGKPGQRRASGIVRGGEEGADELARFLAQRQLDQTDRVSGLLEGQLGFRAAATEAAENTPDAILAGEIRSAAQTEKALREARKITSRANYDAARQGAGAVNLNSAIGTIDDLLNKNPIIGESSLAKSEMGNRLQSLRNQMISADGNEQLIDFDRVLNLKQDIGRQIERLKRSGDLPPEISAVYRELDTALESASPSYRAANDTFRSDSAVIEALARGGEMPQRGRAVDNLAELGGMTPTQRNAARIGYGDERLRAMEATRGETTNRMLPFNATKAQQEMGALAQDPAMWDRQRMRENTMWQTQNRAMGGSMTADNLADVADNGFAADAMKSIGEVLTGNLRQGAGNAASAVSRAAGGLNAPTRELIARALMSGDASILSGASRAQATAAKNQTALEAAILAALRGQINAQGNQ